MEKKYKFKDPTNKILCTILLVTLIANSVQIYLFNSPERFDWTTTVISSKGNIVQVSDCNFKGNSYRINKDMILNSWDKKNNSEYEIKNTFLPDSLSITWFSYIEQKFYNGVFSLPYESILEKAKQLDITHSKKTEYSVCIVAEVQPKGKVDVWIEKLEENYKGKKLKIGTFQAKEINATWHIFDHYLETDKTSDIDISKQVALVMEQHLYRLEIKLPNGYTLEDSYFKLFNQNIWYNDKNKPEAPPLFNFLPQQYYLKWGNGRKNFSTQFYFDEDEVLDAFRKNNNKSEPLVLELILSDRYNFAKVVLRNNKTNSEIVFKDKY